MITHLIKTINWIDVALLVLFVRMIFVGIKNGFVSEFTKFVGVLAAVFLSLHYYSFLAAWGAQKTNFSSDYWDLAVFALLWFVVAFFFKLVRDGLMLLFKVETNHQGFDKYAAGVVAVGRGILVCSMAMYAVLLAHHAPTTRMTVRSYSFKIAGNAAMGTYTFFYNNVIGKLCPSEHYNASGLKVLHPSV